MPQVRVGHVSVGFELRRGIGFADAIDDRAAIRFIERMASVSTPQLPYAHLNLRRNPFGELTRDEWARLAIVDVDPLVSMLSRPHSAIQFVGDKGYGKTTHLLALQARFPQAGYVHIPEGETRPVPNGSPLLIDEAQRLTWRQRRSVFRSSVPLVLGTHRDFERSLRRAGRNVTTIPVETHTSPDRLHQILNARIQASRRADGPVPSVSRETAAELLKDYGPDVRRIVHELYEKIQRMPTAGEL